MLSYSRCPNATSRVSHDVSTRYGHEEDHTLVILKFRVVVKITRNYGLTLRIHIVRVPLLLAFQFQLVLASVQNTGELTVSLIIAVILSYGNTLLEMHLPSTYEGCSRKEVLVI